MNKTYIKIGDLEFEIFLRDTFTAKEIYKNMPISGILVNGVKNIISILN